MESTRKILIIGKNSYIGNHIDEWLRKYGYQVTQLDVLTESWQSFDYSSYDTIIHVAGIVHQPKCRDWNLFKKVNAEMPVAIAKIAKQQGVKQYVYFSTMAVYGVDKKLQLNEIGKHTPLNAQTLYGKSKLLAEEGLTELQESSFHVAIVRPPSVYGKGSRGNYIEQMASVVRYIPIIPEAFTDVKHGFIYIDNLCELVRFVVEGDLKGFFHPQDERTLSANELWKIMAPIIGKKPRHSRFLGLFVKMLYFCSIVRKVYGGVEYAKSLTTIEGGNYCLVSIEEGMRRTMS